MNGYIDDDIQSMPPVPLEPQSGIPSGFNSSVRELKKEDLERIINNPNEHPEIRADALKTKKRLFPDAPEPKKILKSSKKKKSPQIKQPVLETPVEELSQNIPPQIIKSKMKQNIKLIPEVPSSLPISEEKESPVEIKSVQAKDEDVNNFMMSLSKDLYQEEIQLLSDPTISVQMKSMSVEEYKFLTKRLEIFEKETKDLKSPDVLIDIEELKLSNALNVILQRCIVNDVNVLELTIYDWVYLLLTLRCISRPTDSHFKISKPDPKNPKEKVFEHVKIDMLDLLKTIKDNKDLFMLNPMGYVEINEQTGLYLMIPTQGDLAYIENEFSFTEDDSVELLKLGLSMKAFVKDGKAFMMNPHQRIVLLNTLKYDIISNIKQIYEANMKSFFDVINSYFRKTSPIMEALDVSDFILFFYDF